MSIDQFLREKYNIDNYVNQYISEILQKHDKIQFFENKISQDLNGYLLSECFFHIDLYNYLKYMGYRESGRRCLLNKKELKQLGMLGTNTEMYRRTIVWIDQSLSQPFKIWIYNKNDPPSCKTVEKLIELQFTNFKKDEIKLPPNYSFIYENWKDGNYYLTYFLFFKTKPYQEYINEKLISDLKNIANANATMVKLHYPVQVNNL